MLDRVVDELRRDRSRTKLAQAVTMYHFVVEATLAQPGQHFISDYLKARDLLPGFREGMHNVALDEQRHIGFGVKLLRDLALEDPEVPDAVAEQLRAVTPVSLAVFVPPGWDTSYVECFGFTLEQIYEEGARSFEAKFRAAGLPIEELPGPQIMPMDLPPAGRAAPRAGHAAGRLPRRAATARRRATPRRWRCCSTACAATSTCGTRPTGRSCSSGSSRTPSRGTCGSTTARRPPRRAAPRTSTSSSAAASTTGSTSSPAGSTRARRSPPAGCGRKAKPRALWRARGLFTS